MVGIALQSKIHLFSLSSIFLLEGYCSFVSSEFTSESVFFTASSTGFSNAKRAQILAGANVGN